MVIRIRNTGDSGQEPDDLFAEPPEDEPRRARKPYAVLAALAAALAFLRSLMADDGPAPGAAAAATGEAGAPAQPLDLTRPIAGLPPDALPEAGLARGRDVSISWSGNDLPGRAVQMPGLAVPAVRVANDNGYVLPDAREFLATSAQTAQPLRDATLSFRDPPPAPPPDPPPVTIEGDTDCGCDGGGTGAAAPGGWTPSTPDRRSPPGLEPAVVGTIVIGGGGLAEATPPPGAVVADDPAPSDRPDGPTLPPTRPEQPPVAPPAPPSEPQDPPPSGPGAANPGIVLPDPAPVPETGMPPGPVIMAPGTPSLILGTIAAEAIVGSGGDDTIFGGAGDDLILGGAGDDLLFGGAGNDTLLGDAGADTLLGESGDDVLLGGDGDDVLLGDAGNDSLFGGAGDDLLYGGAGDDLLQDGSGADTLLAGDGNDHVLASPDAAPDHFDGGAGEDRLDYGATTADLDIVISGGAGLVIQSDGSDSFSGFETIAAGAGNDHFTIGAGSATLLGAAGNDIFEFQLPLPPPAMPPAMPSAIPGEALPAIPVVAAPLGFEYRLEDFEPGDRIRLRRYDLVDEALDEFEDQFEEIYGIEIDDDDLRISIAHETDDGGTRTIIRGTMENDDSFILTITLDGHRAMAVVEFA